MNDIEGLDEQAMKKRRTKARLLFVSLALAFVLPYVISMYYFYNQHAAEELKTNNKGQLISPLRPWLGLPLTGLDGKTFSTDDLLGHWVIATLADSICETQCNDNLISMRQVRLALGANRSHVERILLLADENNLDQLQSRLTEFERMRVGILAQPQQHKVEAILSWKQQPLKDSFFLIDPKGNYALFYPAGTHPKDLLKDLERLIKVMES